MSTSVSHAGLFRGTVLLVQGVTLWVMMVVLTSVPAAGLESTVLAEVVRSLQTLELWYLYEGLRYGGLTIAVIGPAWYWVVAPLYRLTRSVVKRAPAEQPSLD